MSRMRLQLHHCDVQRRRSDEPVDWAEENSRRGKRRSLEPLTYLQKIVVELEPFALE